MKGNIYTNIFSIQHKFNLNNNVGKDLIYTIEIFCCNTEQNSNFLPSTCARIYVVRKRLSFLIQSNSFTLTDIRLMSFAESCRNALLLGRNVSIMGNEMHCLCHVSQLTIDLYMITSSTMIYFHNAQSHLTKDTIFVRPASCCNIRFPSLWMIYIACITDSTIHNCPNSISTKNRDLLHTLGYELLCGAFQRLGMNRSPSYRNGILRFNHG